jgi:hypothetical protein
MASSWSEQAGPAVKQDVASLLNAAFDVTSGTFDGGIASRHFMIRMDLEGALNARMAYAADGIDRLVESVIDDEPSLRAVLIVPDCGDERSPTLRGYGDHREGPAFDVTITWRRRPGAPLLDVVSSQISHSSWWLFE